MDAADQLAQLGQGLLGLLVGGADPAAGSGLAGLADRIAVVDGRLLLSSPAGGPTLVRVEIPCAQTVPSA